MNKFTYCSVLLLAIGVVLGRYSVSASHTTHAETDSIKPAANKRNEADRVVKEKPYERMLPRDSELASGKSENPIRHSQIPAISIHIPESGLPDFDNNLRNLIENEFGASAIENTFSTEDGEIGTEQTTADGGKLHRLYGNDGILIGESWKGQSESEVSRDFYKSGALKGFLLKKSDGSSTTISFTESGYFKSRVDQSIKGEKFVTEFDDRGELIGRIKIDRDGNASRIRQ